MDNIIDGQYYWLAFLFVQKLVFTTVPKLELRIVLPYLGNISSITKKRLNRCISKRLWNFVNLKSFFKQVTDPRTILDLNILFLKSYNLTLSINLSAEAVQLPITVNSTDIWWFGFQNTRVCLLEQGTSCTSVRNQMLDCDHTVAWEDFYITGRELNHYLLETKESLFVKRDNSSLTRNKYSQELFLF